MDGLKRSRRRQPIVFTIASSISQNLPSCFMPRGGSFSVKVFTVAVTWPGATAPEMQDPVAEPLEKRMQELRYYDYVETFTRSGLAFMTVTLKNYTLLRFTH